MTICERTDGQDDLVGAPQGSRCALNVHFPQIVSLFHVTLSINTIKLFIFCNGGAACFLWGRISICKCYSYELRVSKGYCRRWFTFHNNTSYIPSTSVSGQVSVVRLCLIHCVGVRTIQDCSLSKERDLKLRTFYCWGRGGEARGLLPSNWSSFRLA
jgi:hypothetical protein